MPYREARNIKQPRQKFVVIIYIYIYIHIYIYIYIYTYTLNHGFKKGDAENFDVSMGCLDGAEVCEVCYIT